MQDNTLQQTLLMTAEMSEWFIFASNFFIDGGTVPSGPGPPHYRDFMITLRHTPHSVGLLWTNDQPNAETST
jgi:hypothetical protein